MNTKILISALFLGALLPAAAFADPYKGGGHGNGHDKKEYVYRFNDDDNSRWGVRDDRRHEVVVIHSQDRVVIRDYLRSSCPPGLAKKHNGCTPPGHARYRVGEYLPDNVAIYPVPENLRVRLEPQPAGYRYVRVDKDILLISEASKMVIDAVTLLSAVGS